jgi:DNA-binding MarR family transcriptional regulator
MESVFNLDYQNQNLDGKITVGIEKLSSVFRGLIWEETKNTGLSPIQLQILIFLKYHSENLATVSYLAKEFNVTKPTISDAIKVLEQKKIIKKTSSKNDTRSYLIQLTALGKKMVVQSENFSQPFSKIIETLNTKDKIQFWSTITQLIAQLNTIGLISVQRICYTCKFYEQKKNHSFCHLLMSDLKNIDIRIDCPEHQIVA